MPKVSIVIPTYNRPGLLKRAIASVQAQTYKNYNIWVVQNGPVSKETREIVESFKRKDLPIHYHHIRRADPTCARNIGIKLSRGEYIAFLDDDDQWLPEKLERQVSMLDRDPELAFVACEAWLINEKGEIIGQTQEKECENTLLEFVKNGNFIRSLSLTVLRRKYLEQVGLFKERYPIASDYELYLRLVQRFRFRTMPERLASYRVHEANLSTQGYFGYRERYEIIKLLRSSLSRGAVRDAASEHVSRMSKFFYREASDALDREHYADAVRYYRWSIYGDPFVGYHIPWSKFANPLYCFLRPYLALAYASLKSFLAPERRRKVRIGYFLIGKAIGGNGAQVKTIIEGLDPSRYEAILYLHCPESRERTLFVEAMNKIGVKIRPITVDGEWMSTSSVTPQSFPSLERAESKPKGSFRSFVPETLKAFVYNLRLILRIKRQLMADRLEVVHFSMGIFPELLPTVVAARWARIPHRIAFVHTLGTPPYQYQSFVPKLLLALAIRGLTVVITLGKAMKNILIEHYGFKPQKVHTVPNGISIQAMSFERNNAYQMKKELDETRRIVLVPARLSEEKGHRFLIEAVSSLESKGIYATYLFAGDGPLQGELKQMVLHLKLEHCVKFLGFRTDLQQLMSMADFIVLPSLNEGFPFALLEAMVAGKPFIATRVGCVEDMVEQDANGKLIPAGDAGALESALIEFLSLDKEKLEEMGRRGREKTLNEFTLEKMQQRTFKFYPTREASLCAAS